MIFVGIDNGLAGGIVAIKEGKILLKRVMPIIKGDRNEYDIAEIINIFIELTGQKYPNDDILVILEKAQITPIAGKNSCFSMGYCFGMMQGLLTALNIPFRIVHAKTWQKEVLRDINGNDTKQRSIIFCQRMFPNEDFKATDKCTKVHDGLTDACCMAYFGENFRK